MCYAAETHEVILERTHRMSGSWEENVGLQAQLPHMQVQPISKCLTESIQENGSAMEHGLVK